MGVEPEEVEEEGQWEGKVMKSTMFMVVSKILVYADMADTGYKIGVMVYGSYD